MKNVKLFALAVCAAFCLVSCINEVENTERPVDWNGSDVAYLAIDVDMAAKTRAGSSEEDGIPAESVIKSLYLITLDGDGDVLGIPGGSAKYISITNPTSVPATPDAVKVSAAAKNLVVIANAGPKVIARLNTMTEGMAWASINAAITDAAITEIRNTTGFTMITAGDATGKTPVGVEDEPATVNNVETPFVDIDGKVVAITGTESDAKTEAEDVDNRVEVRLERLTSKLALYEAANVTKPAGSTFAFDKWTVDAINTTFFPFAVKTLTDGTHVAGVYANHFYTTDPNFNDVTPPAYHSGLIYGFADAANEFEPNLPQEDWLASGAAVTAYVIENTMAATAQRYGNATRLVIRATYYPDGITSGDWFSFAGVNYGGFDELKAAYAAADATQQLKDACDDFLAKVKDVKSTITAATFEDLTATDLTDINNGGDVVKNDTEPVIRWYQGGRNYYYYEIRHDNERDGEMLFSKYGVVRNNSYKLTLESVSGAGTPWYPDLVEPGDGDPKPEDPIDTAAGFLGVSVEVNPWILWETGFGI